MIENVTNISSFLALSNNSWVLELLSVLWAIIATLSTIYFARKMRLLKMSDIIPRFEIVYKRMLMPDIDVEASRKDVEEYGAIQDYLLFRESNGKEPYRLEYEYWIKKKNSSKVIKRKFSNPAGRAFIPQSQVNNYRIIPLFLTKDKTLKIDNETAEKILWRVWYRDAGENIKFCLCSVFERDESGWRKIGADFHTKGLFPIILCEAKKELMR